MKMKTLLKIRKRLKKSKPEFKRQEWFRKKSLKKKWVRPKGRQSKLRKKEKARGKYPTVGYRSPKLTRGLTKEGFSETRVCNLNDMKKIDPKKDVIIIASTVGKGKREKIIEKAEEMGVKIKKL